MTPQPPIPEEPSRKLGKLMNQGWHATHTASLEELPETAFRGGRGARGGELPLLRNG